MKVLLLKIRLFFSQKKTKDFLKLFFISLPICLVGSFFLISGYIENTNNKEQKNILQSIVEMADEERVLNAPRLIENDGIERSGVTNPAITNFWKGTALDYRYLIPKHKK